MSGRHLSIVAALLLVIAVPLALFWEPGGGTGVIDTVPAQWYQPQYCQQCHSAIYDEWRTGLHSQSDSDPERLQLEIAKNYSV